MKKRAALRVLVGAGGGDVPPEVKETPNPRSEQEQWLAEATNSSKLGAGASGAIAALLAVVSAVKGVSSGVAIAVVVVAGVAIAASGAIVMTDL